MHNKGLAKVAAQRTADTFVVNQSWLSAGKKKDTRKVLCITSNQSVLK